MTGPCEHPDFAETENGTRTVCIQCGRFLSDIERSENNE